MSDRRARLDRRSLRAGRRGLRRGAHLHRRPGPGRPCSLATLPGAMSTCSGGPSRAGRTPPSGGGTRRIVRADIRRQPPITARDIVQTVRSPARRLRRRPSRAGSSRSASDPRGIVAEVHSDLDWDDWVRRKLGARTNNEWVTHLKSVDFLHGVLHIKLDNGPGLKVVWADEGLEPGDYQDRGFGWYSPDGEHWTEMAPNGDPSSPDRRCRPAALGASWACRMASSPRGRTPTARALTRMARARGCGTHRTA